MPAALRSRFANAMRTASIGALVAVAAGACSPAATAVPATATPATAGAPTTPAVATGAAGPAEPCATTPASACTQFGGDYRSTRFTGGVSYHLVGEVWTNVANEPDVLIVQPGTTGFGGAPDEWLVLVNGAPVLTNDGSGQGTTNGATAMALLDTMSEIEVTPVANPVPIDGQPGVAFRVANTGTAPVSLFGYPKTSIPGGFTLPAAATAEIHWLTIGGAPVLVIIAAPSNQLEGTLTDIADTIASIDFGD